jgi:hypothetical protein
MRVAPFPMRNTVPTSNDGMIEEAIQAGRAQMLSLSPYEAISHFTDAVKLEGRELLKSKAYEGRADALTLSATSPAAWRCSPRSASAYVCFAQAHLSECRMAGKIGVADR